MSQNDPWSLTQHLYSLDPTRYAQATQPPSLREAAQGRLSKPNLSHWLANDRLYIHSYIKGAASLLHTLRLPRSAPLSTKHPDPVETKFLDWLIEALANVRREERFFIDVAERYGLNVNLPIDLDGGIAESSKSEGLIRFESLFTTLPAADRETTALPWLEGAVVFWGTEKVYFDAWSWAGSQLDKVAGSAVKDMDGGALRNEFIPNWSSSEFAAFVDQLESIINQGVAEALEKETDADMADVLKKEFTHRAEVKWKELIEAETAFWPNISQ